MNIKNIPLQLTIVLGSLELKVKDLDEIGIGSIIEVDKIAGSDADVCINGKVVAHGELCVVNEHYGIKITGVCDEI